MTAGYSGSYAIGGVELLLQPTSGKWVSRPTLGIGGSGHPIYPAVREFELQFILADPSDFNQLQVAFQNISNTGTAVVDLPQYGASTYLFYSYSGCVLHEPEASNYFNEYQTEVRWLISNIRTG